MSDRIVLTIPSAPQFRSIATLVLGGVGARTDMSYERMDDFQLAVLSALEAAAEESVTLEVDTWEDGLGLTIGPVRNGSGSDRSLGLVLSRLVDEVAHEEREGVEWISMRLRRPATTA